MSEINMLNQEDEKMLKFPKKSVSSVKMAFFGPFWGANYQKKSISRFFHILTIITHDKFYYLCKTKNLLI